VLLGAEKMKVVNFSLYHKDNLFIEGKIIDDDRINYYVVAKNILRMFEELGYTVYRGYIIIGDEKYTIESKVNYALGKYESILNKVVKYSKKEEK